MERKVEFKSGENILRGTVFIPNGNKGPFPGVILFHGSGSKAETFYKAAPLLQKEGILAFVFNFTGCGISAGDFSKERVKDGIEDARKGIEAFLSFPELDTSRRGICGGSYGGFLAALLAEEYSFTSLMLMAPSAYSREGLEMTHDVADDKRGNFYESDSYDAISKFTGDLLVVFHELDTVVPKEMVEEYVKKTQKARLKEKFVLKGAPHSLKQDIKAQDAGIAKIAEWFKKTL